MKSSSTNFIKSPFSVLLSLLLRGMERTKPILDPQNIHALDNQWRQETSAFTKTIKVVV